MNELSRRDFLSLLGFGTAAFMVPGCCSLCGGNRTAIALQLFSIHQIFWKRPEEILVALKAGGFEGVEFAGYDGRNAKQLKKLLVDSGLRGAGTHVNGNVDLRGDNLKRTLDFCAEAGIESVTSPHAHKDTEAEYRRFGYEMGLAAEEAKQYGIKVGIHSTYHHFTTKYNGITAWDVMFSEASPLLQQQIDLGNTFHTGTDVVALLKKYPNRHDSIHAKENDPTPDAIFGTRPTDGGKCVPWSEVISYMKTETNQRWWVVEAECKPDTLEPSLECRRRLAKWLAI